MQTLDLQNPGLPDLQFVLLVSALMTSDLSTINVPNSTRQLVFDRCWALLHDTPPPVRREERTLDLRQGDEVMLAAMVEIIRRTFADHGVTHLEWDHPPSEPTRSSSPEAKPLVERFNKLYPFPPPADQEPSDPSSS